MSWRARFVAGLLCGLVLGAWFGGVRAQEGVDLELVLLADGSRSIDEAEIRFQRQGYAAAITDEAVLGAISGGYGGRIALTYVEWGGIDSQVVIVPWMVVDGAQSAQAFADALLASTERAQGVNAIGTAIAFGQALIETNDYEAPRRVIDFSGDSAFTMDGIPITAARDNAVAAGITINGLAVLCYSCSGPPVSYDLSQAYADLIIGGPGSFVLTADDRTRFLEAVRRKLILEIADAGS